MKAKRKGPGSTAEWLSALADRTGTSQETIRQVLRRHAVEAQPTLPRARTITIRALAFAGVKKGTDRDGPFTFPRMALGAGLWAFLSDENLRGKSTILGLVRGSLVGDLPRYLKADVWHWLTKVDVEFDIDMTHYRLVVTKAPGEDDATAAAAVLSRCDEGSVALNIYDGKAGADLEECMSSLFMDELGFAKFQAYHGNAAELVHSHGWPAMASGLFISGPGAAIFGDVLADAMPLRLLQLFIGLPWISTYTAASTSHKVLEAEIRKAQAAATTTHTAILTRLTGVRAELADARSNAVGLPDQAALHEQLHEARERITRLQPRRGVASEELAAIVLQLRASSETLAATQNGLQQLKDQQAAGRVFRELRPTCCPACTAELGAVLMTSETGLQCGLCGAASTPVDEEQDLADLTQAVEDATTEHRRLHGLHIEARNQLQRMAEEENDLFNVVAAVTASIASQAGAAAVHRVASLEAIEAELVALSTTQALAQSPSNASELDILKHAATLAKEMFDGLQTEVLAEVSDAITELSRALGVPHLARATLVGNGVLRIEQGDSTTSFSNLAPGERLRIRVAAALAVVQVARKRGHGRHPGLLVLDSPGAQEMSPGDYAMLLANVQKTVDGTPGLQIILGAVARPEIVQVVPPGQQKYAKEKEYLF